MKTLKVAVEGRLGMKSRVQKATELVVNLPPFIFLSPIAWILDARQLTTHRESSEEATQLWLEEQERELSKLSESSKILYFEKYLCPREPQC